MLSRSGCFWSNIAIHIIHSKLVPRRNGPIAAQEKITENSTSGYYTGCSEKIVFFFKFTAAPPSPTSLLETFKALNAMRVTPIGWWQTFLEKNTIFNEHSGVQLGGAKGALPPQRLLGGGSTPPP